MASEKYKSGEVDGASAVGHEFDTVDTLANAGSKIISVKNAGTEKLAIGPEGAIYVSRAGKSADANTAGEFIIGVTDTSSARTITLDSDDVIAGRVIIIKDESGNAGTNNITIATEGSETIDGASSIDITQDYGSYILYSDGTNWFSAAKKGGSGGGSGSGSGGGSGGGSARREIHQISSGSTPPTQTTTGADLTNLAVLSFDAAANEDVIIQVPVPDNLDDTADANIVLKYSMDTDNGGDVKIDIDYVVADLTEDVDPASYEGNLTSTFTPGSGADVLRSVSLTIPNADIPSTDAVIFARITRDAVDSGDTHTGEFQLISVELDYTAA